MSGENFCLKWNDHHSVFFNNIESLCEKSFLTDVLLSAGGKVYPAHKLVLSICSTYFQELFFKPHPAMQQHNTVIYLKDVDPNHLQLLLTYMYRGEVDVGEEHLTDFLKTASGLRVRGLTETDRAGDTVKETAPVAPVAPIPLINHDMKRKSVEMTQLPQVPVVMPPVKKVAPPQEIFIDEGPTTTDMFAVKEERDEPSSTWQSTVTRAEESLTPGHCDAEDYSYQTQTDVSGYDDDKDGFPGKLEMADNYDKHNKAYQCDMCNMSFNQKWLLRRHWKTHTGAKPYRCSVCSRTFSLRDSCTRHIKTVHRDMIDLTKDNINAMVDVTDPDFEPNNVMAVQYSD